MGDKGTAAAFHTFLTDVHVSTRTGMPLSRRAAGNTISRLRRIERIVGCPVPLDDIDDVISQLNGFPYVGNARTALRHWRTFLMWEAANIAGNIDEGFSGTP
jgi:hypothetical protein